MGWDAQILSPTVGFNMRTAPWPVYALPSAFSTGPASWSARGTSPNRNMLWP